MIDMSKLGNYHSELGKKRLLNRAAIICSAGAVFVAFSGFLGWITGFEFLGSISPHFIPMAPTTSICFILLGIILLIFIRYQLQGWSRFSVAAVTVIVSVFGAIELAEHFTGIDVENFFIPDAGMLESMRKARMSPATGATFFFSGVATLLVLLGETKKKQVKRICSCAGIVGSFVPITGVTILMSYLYGNPLLYGGETIPMAATTAIGFAFLGVGLVAAAGPDHMPVRLLVGHSSRAKLLRVFLPLSILIVLSHDILHRFVFVYYHINSALLSVLSLMFFVVITGVIVTVVAGATGRALDEAEKKQKKSAEEWTTTFNSITDWISIHNKDFKIIKANKSFTDSFNMTPKEIIGRHCYELVHGTKEPPPFCPHRQTLKTGKSSCVEFFEPNLGIHIEASTSPIFDEKGQVMASVHIAKDITKRKQAEEKVQSLARFPSENPNPVLRISSDGVVLFANEASRPVLETWGVRKGQPLSHDCYKRIEKVVGSCRSPTFELECSNGRIFLITLASVAESGYVNAYGLDITERKEAEDAMERLNEELERTVEKLSAANRELKDFAHITAHDLKAPLRGIGTLAEWLATDYADKFDEEGKKQVGLLVQKSQEMYDQISGILHFSEIGQGRHECERIDLNGLIEKIIKSLNLPENIQITIADKLPTLLCAQVHLTQIFQNLLSNAIKYTDKPDVRITVGCVAEGDFWKFNVTDNGPGIEEEYFDKIFQIFQTLPVEGEHRSTGIGLAIVRKAVEMYGGKIWVESAPGRGTTFFFTFPKQEMKVACDEKLEANIVG